MRGTWNCCDESRKPYRFVLHRLDIVSTSIIPVRHSVLREGLTSGSRGPGDTLQQHLGTDSLRSQPVLRSWPGGLLSVYVHGETCSMRSSSEIVAEY